MHLVYFDESGQTGNNLRDPFQPIFVLGALVVPENIWVAVEKDLQAAIEKHFPARRPDDFEIHATEISNPRKGYFKQFPIAQRLAFRDEWFRLARTTAKKGAARELITGSEKVRPTLVAAINMSATLGFAIRISQVLAFVPLNCVLELLSGHEGDDAHHYQERKVRNAILEASK